MTTPPLDSPADRPAPPVLSIVVISYETREMTLACLASVAAETTTPHEVIVVDNASTDGSAEAIAAAHPGVTLLAETTNHGFAPAHSIALAHARAPWVLLLNPDTVVLDGAIDRLVEAARAWPEPAIWGGRTLFADRSLNPGSAWGRQTLWSLISQAAGLSSIFRKSSLFNPEGLGGWDRSTPRAVDIVSGCFLLLPRAMWDGLGGFDPAFTMYGEETDLCLRARARGIPRRILPEATIIHYGGASEKVRTDKMVRLMRAKTELVSRHFPPATRGLGRGLLAAWPLSRALAHRALGRSGGASAWGEIWQRRGEWRGGMPRN